MAIDHGSSFDSWLLQWGSSPVAREAIKRGIIDASLSTNLLSGLVVGVDLAASLDAIVASAEEVDAEVWFGLPDQAVEGDYDAIRSTSRSFPLAAGLRLAHAAGAAGVKTGFSLAPHAGWQAATEWITAADVVANDLGLEIIVEPYFAVAIGEADRRAFLKDLAELSSVRFAKLEVHAPTVWGPTYGKAGQAWLARSEGLSWPQYSKNLEVVTQHGCAGTMVGGALWGIEQPVLGMAYLKQLHQRLNKLKSITSS